MIPDEKIEQYFASLFGNSQPEDSAIHYLMFVTGNPADANAFGLPQPDKLQVSLYALAPVAPVDVDQFIADAIRTAMRAARLRQEVTYFVALALEAHEVASDGNELTENLARRLKADQQLQEHPAAVEVTRLYAACRDGRRWFGTHFLTGMWAGTVEGPDLMEGPAAERKWSGRVPRLIRAAVSA